MTAALKDNVRKERPPIVVVMGHVDHGKTTLLDTLRKRQEEEGARTKQITAGEAGGITQHVGAYEITHGKKRMTFIDTPGHEAFSAMRSRGTDVADIALVVIALDDGVKPQTKEVLSYIKKVDIPLIVVLNKKDLKNADAEKVKNQLMEHEVFTEDRGGKVPVVQISAKGDEGIDELLDMILLVAELEEFSYHPTEYATGYVIESHLDSKRGMVTSIVVTNGTLRIGDLLVCGPTYGKIKAMEDDNGEPVKGATPSIPIRLVGIAEGTVAGDPCHRVETETEAKEETERNKKILEERRESMLLKPGEQETVLPIIVKADVQGSLEALVGTLRAITSERIGLNIVRCEVGDVGEGDVKFAEATQAVIFAFYAGITKEAKARADQKGVHIHSHNVIYELLEKVREEMSHLLEPEIEREELGTLDVLAIFRTEPNRMIVGGKVTEGKMVQGEKVEVLRANEVLGIGKIVKLQVGENEKKEVKTPDEAGVLVEGKVRIKEGDTLTAFKENKSYPTLSQAL